MKTYLSEFMQEKSDISVSLHLLQSDESDHKPRRNTWQSCSEARRHHALIITSPSENLPMLTFLSGELKTNVPVVYLNKIKSASKQKKKNHKQ